MSEFSVKVEPDPATAKLMRDIARRFPREMKRAIGRTASIIARQLRAALRAGGGKNGVPKWASWHPFTPYLRSGQAMTDLQKQIVVKRYGSNAVEIGWVEGLQNIAEQFHGGGRYEFSAAQRAYLYYNLRNTGGAETLISEGYNLPERRLYEPYAQALPAAKVRQWMLGNVRKMIEKSVARHN